MRLTCRRAWLGGGAARAAALALACCAASCVPSYRRAAPLTFAQLPYRSLRGQAWPLFWLVSTDLPARYGMRTPRLRVAYVELNPRGARTIVFVHGMSAQLRHWQYQLDDFAAAGYRVLALDLPGYGKSDKPGSFPYTMESLADALLELLERRGIEAPIIVGHSMGGHIALSLAIRHPRRVGALVLTNSAGLEYFSRGDRAWFEKITNRGSLGGGLSEYALWGAFRLRVFSRWRDDLRWLIEERVRLQQSAAAEFDQSLYAMVKCVRAMSETEFTRQHLGQLELPTLIVFGADDRLIPNAELHGGTTRSVMAPAQRAIRGATLVALPRCGHEPQLDCPTEYNRALAAWLSTPGVVRATQPSAAAHTGPRRDDG
ncbi:MAG: alpha/beta fold hydrolase [Proteobacteria bacterium]|nr:alpha/beta fold hydrolase [Pseudomonadota bacterium]